MKYKRNYSPHLCPLSMVFASLHGSIWPEPQTRKGLPSVFPASNKDRLLTVLGARRSGSPTISVVEASKWDFWVGALPIAERIALLWGSEAWEMLCKAIDLLHDIAEIGSREGIEFPHRPRTCSS